MKKVFQILSLIVGMIVGICGSMFSCWWSLENRFHVESNWENFPLDFAAVVSPLFLVYSLYRLNSLLLRKHELDSHRDIRLLSNYVCVVIFRYVILLNGFIYKIVFEDKIYMIPLTIPMIFLYQIYAYLSLILKKEAALYRVQAAMALFLIFFVKLFMIANNETFTDAILPIILITCSISGFILALRDEAKAVFPMKILNIKYYDILIATTVLYVMMNDLRFSIDIGSVASNFPPLNVK